MKATILSKEVLSHRWGEYSQYTIAYTRTDGRIEVQEREIQDNGNGATILLYDLTKRTIVLIKQYRLATQINGDTGVLVETVAGLVENRESAQDTIIREVYEETGLQTYDVSYLFSAYSSPGAKTEKVSFFIGQYKGTLDNGTTGLTEEQEDIETFEMPFEEAYQLALSDGIDDAKTILLILYAKLHVFN